MNSPQKAEVSFRIELLISELLRWGVLLALALLGIGTALAFAQGNYGTAGGSAQDLQLLLAQGHRTPKSIGAWLLAIMKLDGQALLSAGLVLLILTPVLRVTVSIGAFLAERDRVYALITSIVLALLALSYALGGVG